MDAAKEQMDMMSRCLAFAATQQAAPIFAPPPPQDFGVPGLDLEEAQRKAAEKERKKREREEADAELMRLHHQNMNAVESWSTQKQHIQQNAEEIALLAQQTADDCLSLLEGRQAKPLSPPRAETRVAVPSSASAGGGFGDAGASKPPGEAPRARSPSPIGTHQARMDARRAARRSRSRSRRGGGGGGGGGGGRERDAPPKRFTGDAPRVPRRLMYSNDANSTRPYYAHDEKDREKPRPPEEKRARSQKRSRSRSRKRSRSRSRRDRRRRSRSRSNSRRSRSRSNSEADRKAAVRKRMREWESRSTGHLWS